MCVFIAFSCNVMNFVSLDSASRADSLYAEDRIRPEEQNGGEKTQRCAT